MSVVEALAKIRIVPVLAPATVEEGIATCRTLYENGLPAAEITFRTEAAEEVIRQVARQFPEMLVGAGTVLNVKDLHRAFDAGARFGVAPGFNPVVVAEAQACGFEFVPGVCTPSEIEQAFAAGCRYLKFFPAELSGGVAMLKALLAPYRHLGIRFMPTGGVKPANAREYLAIPEVYAVGGTWLGKCTPEIVREAVAIAKE